MFTIYFVPIHQLYIVHEVMLYYTHTDFRCPVYEKVGGGGGGRLLEFRKSRGKAVRNCLAYIKCPRLALSPQAVTLSAPLPFGYYTNLRPVTQLCTICLCYKTGTHTTG
jgi:hypothetical protein